jgi:hypothetical protein
MSAKTSDGSSGGGAGTDRTVSRNKFIENIFVDLGIGSQQELTPYRSTGLYFQLEAIHIPNNKASKSNTSNKSDLEIVFHSLAHGGHFDHMIQRYRSPSVAKAAGLLAFGVRLSLTRLQELYSTAMSRNLSMTAATHQRASRNIFNHSSLPIVLVISDAEFTRAEFPSLVEGKRSKEGKDGKAPELIPYRSEIEISYHAEIAVVLYALRSAGLRAADSLHQLQRDIHQINKGITLVEAPRNETHLSLLGQIASSHGIQFIAALIHGQEVKNTSTSNLEPAIRVCSSLPP